MINLKMKESLIYVKVRFKSQIKDFVDYFRNMNQFLSAIGLDRQKI